MIPYHTLAGKLFGQPLLLLPAMAETVASVVLSHARAGKNRADEISPDQMTYVMPETQADGTVQTTKPRASRFLGSPEKITLTSGETLFSPFPVTSQGVAIITIAGDTVNRGAWIGAECGLVSYEGIQHQLDVAMRSDRVRGVILDIDSPGGEATGCFETAAMVRDCAAVKPVIAVANGCAASAAYAMASGAGSIWIAPSGHVGSIGAVALHLDYSQALADAGIKPTLIHAGAHKVDANPYHPLAADVEDRLAASLEETYALFCATVAQGRGNRLSATAARKTEAMLYQGKSAVAAGLADRVGTLRQAISALTKQLTSTKQPAVSGRATASLATASLAGATMSQNEASESTAEPTAELIESSAAEPAATPVADAAAAAPAVVDAATARADGNKEALATAAAVLALPEAKGRQKLAQAMALQGLSVDQARPLLAAAPMETPSLAARMADDPVPEVGQALEPVKATARIDHASLYNRASRGG